MASCRDLKFASCNVSDDQPLMVPEDDEEPQEQYLTPRTLEADDSFNPMVLCEGPRNSVRSITVRDQGSREGSITVMRRHGESGRSKPHRLDIVRFFLAGAGAVAVLFIVFVSLGSDAFFGSATKGSTAKVEVHEVVRFDDSDGDGAVENGQSSDELPSCSETGDKEWLRIVLADFRVPTVLNMSLRLASLKRVNCDPPLFALEWDPIMFIDDKYPAYEVAVLHKFAADCKGESFLMHFKVAGNPDTKFDMEVHHNRGTDLWTLLETNPSPCWLLAGPGTSGSPRLVNPNSGEAKLAAQFAVGEINFRAREINCIDNQQEITLGSIDAVTVVVKTGLMYTILCKIKYTGVSYDATLHVFHRCSGTHTQCFYQLELPDGRESSSHSGAKLTPWCDPLSFRGKNGKFKATGVLNEDRTNSFISQRVLLYPRKLDDSSREPLQERYIPFGEVPVMHDPRADECFIKVAVYNQGQCNAGYASAWAGMMGARQCLENKKTRRLQERKLEDRLCADDPNWSVGGQGKQNCKYFAREGCKGVDYGQFTHCRLSCGSCPPSNAQGGVSLWTSAEYQYMPSVEDLASCSMEPNGQPTGCTGGNMWAMWDNFMAKSKRSLWISGTDCKAYTLKCWNEREERKIANPLNEGLCWSYKDYQLWHKPCSCIEEGLRPTKLPGCDSAVPPYDCSFNIPPAAFVVRGVASGLSFEEACLNFQRHILESGPLYVAVFMGMNFFVWDWEKNPVYTGDDEVAGGTAMQILGWGGGQLAYVKQPHWILRNSWGGDWLDKGSCLWSRGENLHGIENQAGVIMPSPDFKDYSAPVCRLTSWSRKWATEETMEGKILTNYTLTIKVRCSEDCQVRVFFSNKLMPGQAKGKGKELGWEMDGIVRNFDGKKQDEVTAPTIPLHLRGYGLKNEVMWLAVEARDSILNVGETTNVFTIPGVPGVTAVRVKEIPELSEARTTPKPLFTSLKEIPFTTPKPAGTPSLEKVERTDKEEEREKKRKEKKAKAKTEFEAKSVERTHKKEEREKQEKEKKVKAKTEFEAKSLAKEKSKEAFKKKQIMLKTQKLEEIDEQRKKEKLAKHEKEKEKNETKTEKESNAKLDKAEAKEKSLTKEKHVKTVKAAKAKLEKKVKTAKEEAQRAKDEMQSVQLTKDEKQKYKEAAEKLQKEKKREERQSKQATAKVQTPVSELEMKKREKEVKQEEVQKRRRMRAV